MSCEIKNANCPFQIQCLFPTATEDKGSFALYFYSSEGSQEQMVGCAYNGHHRCFHENGFVVTHEGYSKVTITVPDTFATRAGSFGCQKGDIPMVKNCPYPPPEICNSISSTNSEIDLEATTRDNNTSVIIGAVIGVIVVISLILAIGILLFRRLRKNKIAGRQNLKKSNEYENTLGSNDSDEINGFLREEKDPSTSSEKKSEQKHESNREKLCDVDYEERKSDKDFDDKNSDEDFQSKVMRILKIKEILNNLFRNRRLHDGKNIHNMYLESEEDFIH